MVTRKCQASTFFASFNMAELIIVYEVWVKAWLEDLI
jgi:hypothetical protein